MTAAVPWGLEVITAEEWTIYRLLHADVEVATARWRAHQGGAELHHEVFDPRPSVLRQVQRLFRTVVQPAIKHAGCGHIVIADEPGRIAAKRKYLEFMGFTVLEEPVLGKLGAVMEV